MTIDTDDLTALLARIRQLERAIRLWDTCIAAHQASLGVALGQRDRAQAELAIARQELARAEREGVVG